MVCKSHFPESTVYITDISDESLLEEWKPFNVQIPFKEFHKSEVMFNVIFLNDVFEHVTNPLYVLRQLAVKLMPKGVIFIDTPKQFWIYPVTKMFSHSLYHKVLKATVDADHQQIWSRRAFGTIVREIDLVITKYDEISEYTMPSEFYMNNMGIKDPLIRLFGRIFYRNAKFLAKNKIIAVLSNK